MKTFIRRIMKPLRRRRAPPKTIHASTVIERIEEARITLRNRNTPASRLASIKLNRIKAIINEINRSILNMQREIKRHHGIETPRAAAFRTSHTLTITQLRTNKARLTAQAAKIIQNENA